MLSLSVLPPGRPPERFCLSVLPPGHPPELPTGLPLGLWNVHQVLQLQSPFHLSLCSIVHSDSYFVFVFFEYRRSFFISVNKIIFFTAAFSCC